MLWRHLILFMCDITHQLLKVKLYVWEDRRFTVCLLDKFLACMKIKNETMNLSLLWKP